MPEPNKPDPAKPAFLPRTWKAGPEPVDPPRAGKPEPGPGPAADPPRAGKKGKKPAEPAPEEGAGPKVEETPILDTYEMRQRVRTVVGSIMGAVALVALLLLVRLFQPAPRTDSANDRRELKAPIDPRESLEREAAALVENAKQADKLGRFTASVALLKKVVRNYEGTDAAKEANAALDRERRNRPLFEVEAPKQPTGPTPPKVVAAEAKAPAVVATPAPAAPAPPPQPPRAPEVVARPLPNGFKAESSAPPHPTGWPTRITCERDGATLVLVPGGEFLMGREDGEPSERPPHRVRLSTFYIDEHEVTNRQYQIYLKESGRLTGEAVKPIEPERLDLPVGSLTAYEARSYCYWANRRLPTEAQWELAARSEDGRVSYGLAREPTNPRTLEPPMASPADRSPAGAFDMAGNAWEWTSDWYDSRYYASARALLVDPTGPAESRIRPPQLAVKGGSKQGFLTWREGVRVEARMSYLGFRGALPVEQPAVPAPAAGQPLPVGTNPPGGVIPF